MIFVCLSPVVSVIGDLCASIFFSFKLNRCTKTIYGAILMEGACTYSKSHHLSGITVGWTQYSLLIYPCIPLGLL